MARELLREVGAVGRRRRGVGFCSTAAWVVREQCGHTDGTKDAAITLLSR
jgi:hypothetical protein